MLVARKSAAFRRPIDTQILFEVVRRFTA